jgi:TfoX/Sxy family transcriptional regulator of competence genes
MAWVKVPPENHPIFHAALPKDSRVETLKMFGGVAARVNGHVFAGLFGRSTMLLLAEPDRTAALALEGASLFDPMGDGRARSDKVMLPEAMMDEPDELRRWIARAFKAASELPTKPAKAASPNKPAKKPPAKAPRRPKRSLVR